MTTRTIELSDALLDYVAAHDSSRDALSAELIAETRAALPDEYDLQVSSEEAGFLAMLARITGARDALEIGTFTGLSSLAVARVLPEDGRLVCCDISEEWTAVARRYWARAGIADRVELRIGPAAETLAAMPAEPRFDLAFIDADKVSYPRYWAEVVPRMRAGGVIVVDNVLRAGRVLAPEDEPSRTVAAFNRQVLADPRVDSVMLPVADGITVARVRTVGA
ncbi:O-methyltransferase [Dactylosporangium sp. CS-047395]|uniref:O-methyltransferase n=1 Tax=Dactylosporangium sp. CS-047395 TaxID=3239936 RepID=UPI003D8E2B47